MMMFTMGITECSRCSSGAMVLEKGNVRVVACDHCGYTEREVKE